MSELSSHTTPQILVNGEQEQQQGANSAAEERISSSSISLEEECLEDSTDADKEKQARMQSVLQQVRDHIRSQVGAKAPKSSILELVQRVREMETAQMNETEGEDVSSEDKKQGTDKSKNEIDLKEVELCAVFEKKLEAKEKALREEIEGQISQVRKEMQVYTDQALKDLECKLLNQKTSKSHPTNLREQPESRGSDKKQRPSAATSLASRRGRVLTRTMTTIIPKTCAPIIVGPRAKSETLSSSKGESTRILLRDPVISHVGHRLGQSCRPLPPACPPLQQRKKPLQAKTKPAK